MLVASKAPEARLRGVAAGALTATLSTASHAIAGGGLPYGAASALLVLLALVIGALVATMGRAAGVGNDVTRLVALLGLGQLIGHTILAAAGHAHGQVAATPWGVMLGAHLAAVVVGAGLIATGGYLCGAMSRAVRAASAPIRQPVPAPALITGAGADQPLRSALLLAASVSHRGPPVSYAS